MIFNTGKKQIIRLVLLIVQIQSKTVFSQFLQFFLENKDLKPIPKIIEDLNPAMKKLGLKYFLDNFSGHSLHALFLPVL